MTMSLARGLSTINTRKPKSRKLTQTQIQHLQEELRIRNKDLKRQGRHNERMTLDEYTDYVFGKPLKSAKHRKFEPLKSVEPYRRCDTSHIPSHVDNGTGVAAKIENMKYTGTLIKGIATMHKSNAVPIIDDQQAKDIANMRRN
jgi:hypothetical protein